MVQALPTMRRLAALRTITALVAARNIGVHIVLFTDEKTDPVYIVFGGRTTGSTPETTAAEEFILAAMESLDPGGEGHASLGVSLPTGRATCADDLLGSLDPALAALYDALPVGYGEGSRDNIPTFGLANFSFEELQGLPDAEILRRFVPSGLSAHETLDCELLIEEIASG